jgi:hypothetical protein
VREEALSIIRILHENGSERTDKDPHLIGFDQNRFGSDATSAASDGSNVSSIFKQALDGNITIA